MASQKLVSKEFTVLDSEITITETIQKILSKKELEQELYTYKAQQQNLLKQISELKERHEKLQKLSEDVEVLLKEFEIGGE